MMKPKEMAKQMVDSYEDYANPAPEDNDIYDPVFYNDEAFLKNCKGCALIDVNNTLEALEDTVYGDLYEYYIEVKRQLEKL